jgi:hypothetical protein
MIKKKIKKYKFGAKLEENPDMALGINAAIGALDGLSNMIPQDNLSQGAQKGIDIGKGIAKPLDMLIPGLGSGLGFLAEGIGGIVSKIKGSGRDPREDEKLISTLSNMTSNPFGSPQFKLGGKFYQLGNEKVSEFDAPSHNQGGLNIDSMMNPTNASTAKGEVELNEVGIGDYIFSDYLKDENGKTFADNAKAIARKYKGREDDISLNSSEKELSLLSARNESLKQTQESNKLNKFKFGGNIKIDSNQQEELPGDFLSTNLDSILTNLIGEVPTITGKRINSQSSKYPMSPFPNTFSDEGIISDPSATFKMATTDFMSPSFDTFSKGPEVDSKTTMPINGITPQSKNKQENTDSKLLSGLGYGIKGLQTLTHGIQAFQKPDKVATQLNPNRNKIASLAANRKINLQPILNELRLSQNTAIDEIGNNALSDSVKRSNIANVISNTQRNIANTKVQEQELNNQYDLDQTTILNSLGAQEVAARNLSEDLNTRTKANAQIQRDKFLKDSLGSISTHLFDKDVTNKSNNFYTNVLSQKYPDFTVTDWRNMDKKDQELMIYKQKTLSPEEYDTWAKDYIKKNTSKTTK